jgi:hypothetical protein
MAAPVCSGHQHSFAPSWRTVIGKTGQEAASLQPGLYFALEPFIQHMMEKYIGEYR